MGIVRRTRIGSNERAVRNDVSLRHIVEYMVGVSGRPAFCIHRYDVVVCIWSVESDRYGC